MLITYYSVLDPLLTFGPLAPNMCYIYSSLLITTYSGPAPFDLEEVTKWCYLPSKFPLLMVFCFESCSDLLQKILVNEKTFLKFLAFILEFFLRSLGCGIFGFCRLSFPQNKKKNEDPRLLFSQENN